MIWSLLLTLGATLRLTRLVVTDDLGGWLIRDPLNDWVRKHADPAADFNDWGWRGKVVSGIDCPFCVGYWIALVMTAVTVAIRPSWDEPFFSVDTLWLVLLTSLTINWVAAHVGARLGDAGYDES